MMKIALKPPIVCWKKNIFRQRKVNAAFILFWGCLFISPWAAGKQPVQSPSPQNPAPELWAEVFQPQADGTPAFTLTHEFPDREWWRNFQDSYLENYIQTALNTNPDLQNAILRISESQALMKQVRAAQFPTLSAQANYVRQRTGGAAIGGNNTNLGGATSPNNSPNTINQIPTLSNPNFTYNIYSVPLIASYQVDIWGKNHLLTRAAQKAVEEQKQAARAMSLTLVTNVATSYFNLLKTDAQIQILNNLLNITQQSIAIQQQLFQTGISAYDPLLLSAENLATYQQSLTQAQGQQAVYAHQLLILTGQNPKTQADITRASLPDLNFPMQIPAGIPGELVTRRPDILQNELALERAHINIREARREFLPTINLTGSFGFASRELAHLFDWQNHAASIIGQAGQTLFTGGAKTANLQLQKVRAQEQLKNYQSNLLRAYQQVEDSLSSLKADYSGYQTNLQEVTFSQQAVNLNKTRFQQGISPKLDWLNAQRQLLNFQQIAQQNKANTMIDIVNLYGALGGGYTP